MLLKKYLEKLDRSYSKHKFRKVSCNSKKIKNGDVFFAINGHINNGNLFINDAIKNGAKTIISDNNFSGYKNDVLFIKNKNPRKLLSNLINKIHPKKPKNLIAITGTNGKSSIANFYYQILKLNNLKVASIGTLGVQTNFKKYVTENTTSDPIIINKILNKIKKKKINNVILEASSHGLKQHRLDGIKFNTGIFTNLSRDHLDYHKSYKDYLNSKMILFKNLLKKNSNVIFDKEIKQANKLGKICNQKKYKKITIGNNKAELNIINHRYINNFQEVKIQFKKKFFTFRTSLIGKLQIKNLLMAICAAKVSKLNFDKILRSIIKIKPVHGRLEPVGNLLNRSKVILDYAHTPDALKSSLKDIKEQFSESKINLVFGCGGERDKPKRKIMGKIANEYSNKIYLTDDNPRNENPKKIRNDIKRNIIKSKLFEIPSRKNAIKKAIQDLKAGEILLIAGKGHENYQEYSKKKFFSDKKNILNNIKIKNKKLFKNWKSNIILEQFNNKKSFFAKINKANINSKKIKKYDIFFGLKGKKLDGNKFALAANKKGAAFSIVDKKYHTSDKIIKVKDTLGFLTNISRKIKQVSNINSIAITGSSGKTSLKEILYFCFQKYYHTTSSVKSFNNHIGVPLSLFNIKNERFGIFEVGMDKKGEIDSLSKIINPNLAVITNVTYAHAKNFKGLHEIALAKSEIIQNIKNGGTVVLNRDDKFWNLFKKIALKKKLKIISFSKHNKAEINLHKVVKQKRFYKLTINIYKKNKTFLIKKELFPYLSNILAAIAILSNYINPENLSKNLFFDFTLPKGRGDMSKLKFNHRTINLIDESYNSNPLSLKFSINNFSNLTLRNSKKYILLGDMLELGKFAKKLHIDAAKVINESTISKVYVYGKNIKKTFNKIKTQKKGRVLYNENEIINFIKNELPNNSYIMIKGSNATGLNGITSKIKIKGKNAL